MGQHHQQERDIKMSENKLSMSWERAKSIAQAWKAVHSEGGKVDDVAKRLDLSRNTVVSYATKLRAHGVKLPLFARGRSVGPSMSTIQLAQLQAMFDVVDDEPEDDAELEDDAEPEEDYAYYEDDIHTEPEEDTESE